MKMWGLFYKCAGKMSGMQSGAQDAAQWHTGVPHQLHVAKVLGASLRNHRYIFYCSVRVVRITVLVFEMYYSFSYVGELPDPNADAIMSRCNVCSEKAYVNPCAHCDKKVCQVCKDAHCDVLKREIARINNQIKRGWHRLEDCLKQVERNQQSLEANAAQVLADVEEIHRRLTACVKERTDYLKASVDQYLIAESKTLKETRANLELELANIQSNSDLMEKHMSDADTPWDDNELMDCKEIFIKMMDFIRNYDPGSEEYTR